MTYLSCSQCKHCVKHQLVGREEFLRVCQAPEFFDALEEPRLDPSNTFIGAKAVRMLKRECGRNAKWFDTKD